jgi:uncharacterized protein involved in cysteine biosynthesis
MTQVLDALARALRDLFRFRVLWIVVWPMLTALFLWLAIAVAFWGTFSGWIAQGLDAVGIQAWLEGVEPRWIAHAVQGVLHLLLFIPLVFLTALLITALFAAPALVRMVAERDYPQLVQTKGGGFFGSALNALLALLIFLVIWVITLPLWLVGVGVLVPFVAAAYLNQRLFRYDALAEHASPAEMRALFESRRAAWWGLGLVTGLLQFVPLLNLFAAVLAALAFIHFGLARLQDMRASSPAHQ